MVLSLMVAASSSAKPCASCSLCFHSDCASSLEVCSCSAARFIMSDWHTRSSTVVLDLVLDLASSMLPKRRKSIFNMDEIP
eukprot:COSAG02_NODE_11167_length_1778_cov_1.790947_1_plen_80_part_10